MTQPATPLAASAVLPSDEFALDLRDRWLAAFLAWLVPGLGHIYQRRWGKGGLFMTCILATFFYGLWLGGGRVVYASFREADPHYAYLCQIGVGLPALPALVQAMRMGGPTPKAPIMDGFMAPPLVPGQIVLHDWIAQERANHPDSKQFDPSYFPPLKSEGGPYDRYVGITRTGSDQLGQWHRELGSYFDLGTVYTM
ncbi:MAG TPA: DUF6677 family protein, partial [Pirellulales bacterium]